MAGLQGGDQWCFLDWTQEFPPDWAHWVVTFSQFLSRTFVPQLSFRRLAPRVPPSLHSGPEEGVAYKIQLNAATQGPGQETHQLCREHLPRGSSSSEPLLLSSLPKGIQGPGRTEPITICSGGSWELEASPRAPAAVWAWTETVCGTWGLSGEGSTACSTGTRAPSPSPSQPTHLWARPEES